jgi:hypothetical protein
VAEINPSTAGAIDPRRAVDLAWNHKTQEPPDPFAVVNRELPRMGWTLDSRQRTDGPDGMVYAFVRGKLLCVVEGRWDGGLDDDSTVVIDPARSLLLDFASGESCRGKGVRD